MLLQFPQRRGRKTLRSARIYKQSLLPVRPLLMALVINFQLSTLSVFGVAVLMFSAVRSGKVFVLTIVKKLDDDAK